ncbi:hypothetical protein CRP345_gp55 [Roseobacter phage CRP-345]|nr:hypothetical protein CRP345_gp55 [Roseobacter phage CRP-345]
MAVVLASAKYGVGVYGASSYGAVSISFTLSGVAATGAIQPVAINGFEIDISERLGSVSATGSIGTVSPNIKEDITGVSATGAINGSLEFSNTHNVTSVALTGSIGTLAISNTVGLTGVAGTTAVQSVSIDGFEVDVSEALASVSATVSLGTVQPVVNFTKQTGGFLLTASIGTISPNVKEELAANDVTNVSATGSVNGVTVHLVEKLNSVSVTGSVQRVPITPAEFTASINASSGNSVHVKIIAVQFNFEAVKNRYSRRRTVVLPRAA